MLSLRRLLLAPYLESVGIHEPALPIEIESIENERPTLGVKDPAEGFLRAATAINIENIRDIKLSRAHQFANIPVGSEILIRVFEPAFLIPVDGRKFFNFPFERGGPDQYPFAFGPQTYEFGSNRLISLIRVLQLGLRSEEHTSELQSHLNLVCRLLLEKKKTTDSVAARACAPFPDHP